MSVVRLCGDKSSCAHGIERVRPDAWRAACSILHVVVGLVPSARARVQVPTQQFFGEDMGMPLYMEPNFEDLSCKMIFGQTPPPLAEDPVNNQPCFKQCAPFPHSPASPPRHLSRLL